jgi:hypothetical protein
MSNYVRTIMAALCCCLAPFLLSACGNTAAGVAAVSASAGTATASSAATVSGIAAAGKPLSGNVYLRDASYPSRTLSAPINPDGTFSLPVDGLNAPFLLKAVDSTGNASFAFGRTAGIVNINPLSNLAVAAASGSPDQQALSELFDNVNSAALNAVSASYPATQSGIMSALKPLLVTFAADGGDPFAGFFAVNHQGLDDLLGQVTISEAGGMVSITNSGTGASIFRGPLDRIGSAGTYNPAAVPAPGALYLPGNALLTLAIQGTVPEGTRILRSSFTVQLPLGFSADSGPSNVNTAIPIQGAAYSNVYPAPVLSATDNLLTVNLSSLAGFGSGAFLTIRCIATTAALLATNPADFKITAPEYYGDIYKNLRLKGLSIVPVSLAAAHS